MENFIQGIPAEVADSEVGKDAVALREAAVTALQSFRADLEHAESDDSLKRYLPAVREEELAKRRAKIADKTEKELHRIEKLIEQREQTLASDEATALKAPADSDAPAIVSSFTALSREQRLAVLHQLEGALNQSEDARRYVKALLGANRFLNLLDPMEVNGVDTRTRLELALRATNPKLVEVDRARLALRAVREASNRVRERISGGLDVRARLQNS